MEAHSRLRHIPTRALPRHKLKGPDFYDSVQVVIKLEFTAVMISKQTGCHLSEFHKANNDQRERVRERDILFIGGPVDTQSSAFPHFLRCHCTLPLLVFSFHYTPIRSNKNMVNFFIQKAVDEINVFIQTGRLYCIQFNFILLLLNENHGRISAYDERLQNVH